MINDIKQYINKYITSYHPTPTDKIDLKLIEQELEITLPKDFLEISSVYNGGLLGIHSIFSFSRLSDNYNIIDQTLYYRAYAKLPKKFIILSDECDGLILMRTQNNPNKLTPIIDCSIEDILNLIDEKPLEYEHQIFPSFTDFFAYLLEQEESERENS